MRMASGTFLLAGGEVSVTLAADRGSEGADVESMGSDCLHFVMGATFLSGFKPLPFGCIPRLV
jgi:hypothetical protein